MDSSEPRKKKQKPGKRAPTIPGLLPATATTVTSVTWPDLCEKQPQPTTTEPGETSKLDIFEDSDDLDNLDDITADIEALMPTSAQPPQPSTSKTSTEASEMPGTSGGIIPVAPPPPATKAALAPTKPAPSSALTPCLLTTGASDLWDKVVQIIDFEFPDDETDYKG